MESLDRTLIVAAAIAFVLWLVLRRRGETVSLPDGSLGAASVEDLLNAGRKIDAIKAYRRQHGVGLKEAKEAVEAIGRGPAR